MKPKSAPVRAAGPSNTSSNVVDDNPNNIFVAVRYANFPPPPCFTITQTKLVISQ